MLKISEKLRLPWALKSPDNAPSAPPYVQGADGKAVVTAGQKEYAVLAANVLPRTLSRVALLEEALLREQRKKGDRRPRSLILNDVYENCLPTIHESVDLHLGLDDKGALTTLNEIEADYSDSTTEPTQPPPDANKTAPEAPNDDISAICASVWYRRLMKAVATWERELPTGPLGQYDPRACMAHVRTVLVMNIGQPTDETVDPQMEVEEK